MKNTNKSNSKVPYLLIPILFLIGVAVLLNQGISNLRKSDLGQAAACPGDVSTISSYGNQPFIKKCLQVNAAIYSNDPRYTFFRIDPGMEGGTFIQTPNADIKDDQNLNWNLTVTQPGTLYIVTRHIYQTQAASWIRTQYTRQTDDNQSNVNQYLLRKNEQGLIGLYDIYKREVSSGTYSMQAAADVSGGAYSMYIVIFVPNPGTNTTPNPDKTPAPTNPDTSGDFTDCSRYPEKRIFLETQEWWMDTASIKTPVQLPAKGGGGHNHTATCFPQDQLISNHIMHFDVRLMIHKGNGGKVEWLDIGLGPDGKSLARKTFNPPLTCPNGTDLKSSCMWWVPIDLDTSKVQPDGYQELRFRFNTFFPDGNRVYASTGWQAYYRSKSGAYRNPPYIEARGWFGSTKYSNAQFLSEVPYAPISGSYTFKVANKPGSGGAPIATNSVNVDALFAKDDFGKIIHEGTGSFAGNVTVDTTQLTNGMHCIAIVSSTGDHNGGTNTGLLQIPIVVNNPGRPTAPGKGGCGGGT
jgi:hypothetical protein